MRRQRIIEALEYHLPKIQVLLAGILLGQGISSDLHEHSDCHFYIYRVYGIDNNCSKHCLTIEEAEGFRKGLDKIFEPAPAFARRIKLSAFAQNIDELMMKAEGSSRVFEHESQPPNRKGLVFQALDGSISFKAISNGWLLEETDKLREMGEDARRRPGPNDCV